MKNPDKYQPISCTFYDFLEEAATLKKAVNIVYTEGGEQKKTRDRIKNLYIRKKAERVLLASGLEIRLDRLIDVDGHKLADY